MKPIPAKPLLLLIAALCTMTFAQPAPDPEKVASLKALFLYHFSRFTKWPESRFGNKTESIIVGVLGKGEMEGVLESALKDKDVEGRRVVVRRFEYPQLKDNDPQASLGPVAENLKKCHVLFIGRSDRYKPQDVFRAVAGADVLTVGDSPKFTENGGMIGLFLRDKRVQFEVNRTEIEKTAIRVSSKLLSLAASVR